MNTINFYSRQGPHFNFSNFARWQIYVDGKFWKTSEHYYQAMKFLEEDIQEAVRVTATPAKSAAMGRDRSLPLRHDWEAVKEEMMLKALRAKFTQHKTLKDELIETDDAILVEHTKNDRYWGDGGDGTGKNRLGHLLMKVREELVNDRQASI